MPIDWLSREQRREAELAEQAAKELEYALDRMRKKGRRDLAALLEAGEISVNEAFVRLHSRQ
jgi:uncharacterized protein YhaN